MAGLDLTPAQHALLRRIVDAGEPGIMLGADRLGDLIALDLDGLITLHRPLLIAFATAKGRPFLMRDCFA